MIYIQIENGRHCFDFFALAEFGCRQLKYEYSYFEDASEIKHDPNNVIVGSVEQSMKYMEIHGITSPPAIDLLHFKQYLGRSVKLISTKELLSTYKDDNYPIFAKPYDKIKAFDGTILMNDFDAHIVLQKIDCILAVQPIMNILSEYRVYIHHKKILAVKSYLGDPLIFPDKSVIKQVVEFANSTLTHRSYCLDFAAIFENGWTKTILLEPNDAWAIGNYGLEPSLYVNFLKDRWLQITNNK